MASTTVFSPSLSSAAVPPRCGAGTDAGGGSARPVAGVTGGTLRCPARASRAARAARPAHARRRQQHRHESHPGPQERRSRAPPAQLAPRPAAARSPPRRSCATGLIICQSVQTQLAGCNGWRRSGMRKSTGRPCGQALAQLAARDVEGRDRQPLAPASRAGPSPGAHPARSTTARTTAWRSSSTRSPGLELGDDVGPHDQVELGAGVLGAAARAPCRRCSSGRPGRSRCGWPRRPSTPADGRLDHGQPVLGRGHRAGAHLLPGHVGHDQEHPVEAERVAGGHARRRGGRRGRGRRCRRGSRCARRPRSPPRTDRRPRHERRRRAFTLCP